MKILLVDDNEAIRKAYSGIFTRMGNHEVITASDGMMAIQVMEENRDIDILITDNDMPEANGLEVLRRAEELIPNSRRFFMSGRLNQDTIKIALSLHVEACFEKPIEMETFRKHGLLPQARLIGQ